MFFWNSFAFSMIQRMLAIWSLVPLPFLKPAWTFEVHGSPLLKPGLENFEHYFTNMWDECNCVIVWAFFDVVFLWDWNETDLFQSCDHCWVFHICWHIECRTLTALSFTIRGHGWGWNMGDGVLLFVPQSMNPYCQSQVAGGTLGSHKFPTGAFS